MADLFRTARPDTGDDDFRLAMSTLRLTAPYMTREQLTELINFGQELLKDLTLREKPFSQFRILNG